MKNCIQYRLKVERHFNINKIDITSALMNFMVKIQLWITEAIKNTVRYLSRVCKGWWFILFYNFAKSSCKAPQSDWWSFDLDLSAGYTKVFGFPYLELSWLFQFDFVFRWDIERSSEFDENIKKWFVEHLHLHFLLWLSVTVSEDANHTAKFHPESVKSFNSSYNYETVFYSNDFVQT